MKNIYLIISSIFLTLLLSACGGGGGGGGTSIGGGSTQVAIINCDNSNSGTGTNDCGDALVPDYYTCIQDGDTLVKEDDNTSVEIIHSGSNKKVCVVSGTAHILR